MPAAWPPDDAVASPPAHGLLPAGVPATAGPAVRVAAPAGPYPDAQRHGMAAAHRSPDEADGSDDAERRGRLVEAPHVEPGGALVSEIRRRSQSGPG